MSEKKKIVVVDDEPDQAEILREWLSAEYEVRPFTHPADALALFESECFDLLITDFSMPDINGAQLAAKFTKSTKNAGSPVLLLTGIQDALALAVIKSVPSLHLVQKPIRRDDFLDIVEDTLRLKLPGGKREEA